MPIPAPGSAQAVNWEALAEEYYGRLREAERKNERLRAALDRIAAYDDQGANYRLKTSGSYSAFDEPGSVEIAREALEKK